MTDTTKELNKVVRQKRKTQADYMNTFGTDAGKRVLLDLILTTGILEGTTNTDSNAVMIRSGERRIGLHILGQVFVDKAEQFQALQEALEKKNARSY